MVTRSLVKVAVMKVATAVKKMTYCAVGESVSNIGVAREAIHFAFFEEEIVFVQILLQWESWKVGWVLHARFRHCPGFAS
jgi:hypothetical protein